MQEAVFCTQFLKIDETVGGGVVYGHLVMMKWTVDGEKVVEIDKILTKVQLEID